MNPSSAMTIAFSDFTLLRPWWLLALLPCWVLPWLVARNTRVPSGNWMTVVDAHLLPHLVEPARTVGAGAARLLIAGGLTLAIIALSGPALRGRTDVALRSDAMRVLVADLSPTLEEARHGAPLVDTLQVKLLDLLARMPEGQTALIAYADEPYLVAPPTTDTTTLLLFATELRPDVLPAAGDRPERALLMAANLLAESGAARRDVVWIHAGAAATPAVQAVAALQAEGVRVSRLRLAVDYDAAIALHSAILASGGVDLPRRIDDQDVSAVLAHLDHRSALRQEKIPRTSTPHELGPWLLLLLLPFAALVFRRGILALLAAVLLAPPPAAIAGDVTDRWLQPDQRAMETLNRGAAGKAAEAFTDPRWSAVAHYRAGNYADAAALLEPFDDADSLYNRGNALARLQRFDEALRAYDAALQKRPGDPDALHNRDLVRELMKHPPPPPGRTAPPTRHGNEHASPSAPPPAPIASRAPHEHEADRLAEQWLRRVPDEPASLLRRKLELEHRRRQRGEAAQPW